MTKGRSKRGNALKPRAGRRLWIGVSLAIVAAAGTWLFAGIAGCGGSLLVSPSPSVPDSTASPIPGSPIQHIVVIMQENRSFDNLFNGYPGADTVQGGMPWPLDELEQLGETQVEMRVTLSYFIEPNPSSRGFRSRYRYESHGLRFECKAALGIG